MSENVALGLNFGRNSVRKLVVSCADDTEIASAVQYCPSLSEGHHIASLANPFCHHPLDCIGSMTNSVRGALTGVSNSTGIGVENTGSFFGQRPELLSISEHLYPRYLDWVKQSESLYAKSEN